MVNNCSSGSVLNKFTQDKKSEMKMNNCSDIQQFGTNYKTFNIYGTAEN